VRVPQEVGLGNAKVTLSFPAWKEGNVASATLQVPVVKDAPRPPQPPQPPKVVEARPVAVGGPAARRVTINNFKQIGLAFHIYLDTHREFAPVAIHDKDGKALLSWRVAILPYLDQAGLYRQFKLDEPWDSPHNKKLLDKMPAIYGKDSPSETHYRVFSGPGTLFDGTKGAKVGDISDGFSNTILVIETKGTTPWTKPDGIPFGAKKQLPALEAKEGCHILWADGSVQRFVGQVDEEKLRAAITRAGGEIVNRDELTK